MMKLNFLRSVIVLLLILILAVAIFWQPNFSSGNQKVYDFSVQSANGNITLSDLTIQQKKYVLLYFGYTYCPDICPTSLMTLANALNSLPEKLREKFQILFISVDPQRDNLKHLQEYGKFFHKNIISATNFDDQDLQKIADNYKVIYRKHYPKDGSQNYSIDHSANVMLISPENKWIWTFQHGTPAEKIAEILRNYS